MYCIVASEYGGVVWCAIWLMYVSMCMSVCEYGDVVCYVVDALLKTKQCNRLDVESD